MVMSNDEQAQTYDEFLCIDINNAEACMCCDAGEKERRRSRSTNKLYGELGFVKDALRSHCTSAPRFCPQLASTHAPQGVG